MILAFFILFSAFAAFCGLLIYGYRSRAHSAEARANRAEGALGETRDENSFLRGLTSKAIRLAAEAAKLNPDEVLRRDPNETYGVELIRHDQVRASWTLGPGDYVSPITTNCPKCGVSVRHPPEVYPVRCPAIDCGAEIPPPDDVLGADLIG